MKAESSTNFGQINDLKNLAKMGSLSHPLPIQTNISTKAKFYRMIKFETPKKNIISCQFRNMEYKSMKVKITGTFFFESIKILSIVTSCLKILLFHKIYEIIV